MDCPPGSSKVGRKLGLGREAVGRGKTRGPHQAPLPAFPMPAVGGLATLVLTSASFQSPGMQKDSSRSLPHSSKIRSSEEGEFAEGACEDLGSMRLSAAFPDAPRSLPPGLQAPLHHGVCSAEASALSLRSFTDNPCLLWQELLRGGSGLLGTEGFLGSGWPVTLTEREPAMCPKGSGSLASHQTQGSGALASLLLCLVSVCLPSQMPT